METVMVSRSGPSLVADPGHESGWPAGPPGTSWLPGASLTPPPPGRYLYNRMGYWSDWSVPILVTTAAAFTYIAGLLVCAAARKAGRPAPRGRVSHPGLRGELAFPRAL